MQGVNSMKVSIKVETWYKQILTSFFFSLLKMVMRKKNSTTFLIILTIKESVCKYKNFLSKIVRPGLNLLSLRSNQGQI